MRINPAHQGNYNSNNSMSTSGPTDNAATMDMLAALKDQVSDLGGEVAKNAEYLTEVKKDLKVLDEVKDDIGSFGEIEDDIRSLDEAVFELQQQQQQVSRPSCTVNASLSKFQIRTC